MVFHKFIGVVTHFFDRICVAVIALEDELFLDDWILIEGSNTRFEQQVKSMQINHEPVEHGLPGEEIALKVDEPVREGDEIYLIVED